jgi:hypothetical protein
MIVDVEQSMGPTPGVETPDTPDEPDALDGGGGVEGSVWRRVDLVFSQGQPNRLRLRNKLKAVNTWDRLIRCRSLRSAMRGSNSRPAATTIHSILKNYIRLLSLMWPRAARRRTLLYTRRRNPDPEAFPGRR